MLARLKNEIDNKTEKVRTSRNLRKTDFVNKRNSRLKVSNMLGGRRKELQKYSKSVDPKKKKVIKEKREEKEISVKDESSQLKSNEDIVKDTIDKVIAKNKPVQKSSPIFKETLNLSDRPIRAAAATAQAISEAQQAEL